MAQKNCFACYITNTQPNNQAIAYDLYCFKCISHIASIGLQDPQAIIHYLPSFDILINLDCVGGFCDGISSPYLYKIPLCMPIKHTQVIPSYQFMWDSIDSDDEIDYDYKYQKCFCIFGEHDIHSPTIYNNYCLDCISNISSIPEPNYNNLPVLKTSKLIVNSLCSYCCLVKPILYNLSLCYNQQTSHNNLYDMTNLKICINQIL